MLLLEVDGHLIVDGRHVGIVELSREGVKGGLLVCEGLGAVVQRLLRDVGLDRLGEGLLGPLRCQLGAVFGAEWREVRLDWADGLNARQHQLFGAPQGVVAVDAGELGVIR